MVRCHSVRAMNHTHTTEALPVAKYKTCCLLLSSNFGKVVSIAGRLPDAVFRALLLPLVMTKKFTVTHKQCIPPAPGYHSTTLNLDNRRVVSYWFLVKYA